MVIGDADVCIECCGVCVSNAAVRASLQVCLGSLTTLAAALEADRALVMRKVRNVVVMGGALRVSPSAWHDHAFYTQGGAEFNFYFDAPATYKVIHSGLEIVMIGLEVANADVCTSEELAALIQAQEEAKEGPSSPAWLLRALMLAFDMSASYGAVACFHLLRPEHFALARVWVRVDPHSGRVSEELPGAINSVPVLCVCVCVCMHASTLPAPHALATHARTPTHTTPTHPHTHTHTHTHRSHRC